MFLIVLNRYKFIDVFPVLVFFGHLHSMFLLNHTFSGLLKLDMYNQGTYQQVHFRLLCVTRKKWFPKVLLKTLLEI